MKARMAAQFLTLAFVAAAAIGQQTQQATDTAFVAAAQDHSADSPAMRHIAAAKNQLNANQKNLQASNELAAAFIARARETSNPSYLRDAEKTLAQSASIDAKDFQLRKTRVVLLLAQQKYPEARELATELNQKTPDDPAVYGYLSEADIALGDYDAAENATQWMMNLRRNNIPGLLLGADLRYIWGDASGALEFLEGALGETSPTEHEQMAWIANKIASIQLETGKTSSAEKTLERAAQWFPGYRPTLINLARVRLAEEKPADAVSLLEQAAQLHSDACVQYQLLQAQHAAGIAVDSNKVISDAASGLSNDQYCVVLAEADNSATAADAVKAAERVIAVRHDVWSLDAHAWALYVNGEYAQADMQIQKALAQGTESARLFDHAGHIALKLNRQADAAKYFDRSLAANPNSEFALDAHAMLEQTSKTSAEGLLAPRQAPMPPVAASHPEMPAALTIYTATATDSKGTAVISPVPADLLTPRPTGTARMIASAQTHLAASPHDAKALAALGAAFFQRARETADVSDFETAKKALQESLAIDSSSFAAAETYATLAEVSMGEHSFQDALNYADQSLAIGSGDLSPFAIMGDASADMGDYDHAAEYYARLTPSGATLAPGDAYARDSRLAYLNFVHGDTAGAIRLMKIAAAEGEVSHIPSENLAWLHYELGEFNSQAGDIRAANAAYLTALTVHPGDYRALAGLARLRANSGRYEDAVLLYQKAIALVPMPIFVAESGDLYMKLGRKDDADKQYKLVEIIGRLGEINQVLHNRDLAVFYADHDIKLTEAVALARKEFEVRHDIYTWDALAWALYKNGAVDEAYQASRNSLALGTRDALLHYHAGLIALKAGKPDEASQHLKDALAINPNFHLIYGEPARQTLASLTTHNSTKASIDGNER